MSMSSLWEEQLNKFRWLHLRRTPSCQLTRHENTKCYVRKGLKLFNLRRLEISF